MGAGGAGAVGREDRSLTIDLLKVVAAHLIVWHHLAFYGPMSDHTAALWPQAMEALARHGRLAVPVFLVLGGYLAARSLAPEGRLVGHGSLWSRLVDRHLRLSVPLAVVVAFAAAAALLADHLIDHPSIPVVQGGWQMVAHVLLLHDLLGMEALSAGVWYVAIDFQLFAVLLLILTLARRGESKAWNRQCHGPVVVALLGALALLVFNRLPELDHTPFYFFGAYALGALAAWWAPDPRRRLLLLGVLAVVALALWMDWRERVLVAAVTAALLAAVSVLPCRADSASFEGRGLRAVRRCSDRSYALFLVHFPIFMIVNAVFTRWVSIEPGWQALGLLVTWALSLVGAAAFHRWVEQPLGRAIRTLPARLRLAGAGSGAGSAASPLTPRRQLTP